MSSLLVVVKSHLFPVRPSALAGVTGERGEFAVVNRGWAGMVLGSYVQAGRRQSIAVGGQSIGSEVAAAVTHNSDSDSQ